MLPPPILSSSQHIGYGMRLLQILQIHDEKLYSPDTVRPSHVSPRGLMRVRLPMGLRCVTVQQTDKKCCKNLKKLKKFAKSSPKAKGRHLAAFDYSCSFRAFLRFRLRASASFTRFFSPGLR